MLTKRSAHLKLYFVILLFCFKLNSVEGQDTLTKKRTIDKRTIDSIVNAAATLFMRDTSRVGLSIGVYYKGQSYTYHFGVKAKGEGKPDNNNIYEIGSITKTMTGTILAQAVIDHKVLLSDDVRKYIKGSYQNLEYNQNPVRLFQLLNHSSGLPFDLPLSPQTNKVYSRSQFFTDLRQVKIDTVPGIKLSYSNSAAQLLGYILEDIYKKPFEELLNAYIFKPLKMKSTGFISSLQKKDLLNGFNEKGIAMLHNQSGAAGAVCSTIPDMLRYIEFEINETNPVVALSHQPTWGNIQYYAMGLNWQMDKGEAKPRRVFQSGGTAGFSSSLTIYPDLKTGLILLSNEADENVQGKLSELSQQIFNVLNN